MTVKTINFHRYLVLFSIISSCLFAFLSYQKLDFLYILGFVFSLVLIVQLIVIYILQFEKYTKNILSITAFSLSLFIFLNTNKIWMLTYWKYQLIAFLCIIFFYWYLKLTRKLNIIYTSISYIILVSYLLYLIFIVYNNCNSSYYFNIAKIWAFFTVFWGIFLSRKDQFRKVP